jgi:hypothetical protein
MLRNLFGPEKATKQRHLRGVRSRAPLNAEENLLTFPAACQSIVALVFALDEASRVRILFMRTRSLILS